MEPETGMPLPASKAESRWLRVLRKRLPILQWAPRYDRLTAAADLVAGVTLGLTLVPQSIAYAALANLPVQYGLYSSFVGTMLYVLLGTVKEVSIGPTSLMALLTLHVCRGLPVEFVVLLTFLSGCVVLLMGLLRLGFLVDFISPSVTSGFTSATALIIVAAQLKGLLGLSFTAESLLDNVRYIAAQRARVRGADCALGAACCAVLLLLRKLKDIPVNPKRSTLKKALWLVSISRNALVVLVATTFAYVVHDPKDPMFKLSGRVEPGLPPLSAPPFSAAVDNSTVQFVDMVQQLGTGVVLLPVVMVLANIAIAKAFSAGGRVDATQEMVTLGLCNMAGSLVHAMPTCGAFTRSAVSHSSGVRTPAAGLYSGLITLLALIFLTRYFYFIPKACLSSVLICAVIFMIDLSTMWRLWRRDRRALCVLWLTLLTGLAHSVELAVLAGALADAALVLARVRSARVRVAAGARAALVRPALPLLYVSAGRGARRVLAAAARAHPRPVLLDCAALTVIDDAAASMLERVIKTLKRENQKLILYNVPADTAGTLEALEGADSRAFSATNMADALAAVAEAGLADTDALLPKEHAAEKL
ncbi:sodium-independent sulfate anion transporter [Manduca sexta]|uniref:sodium-independent sulfate anion transporter n=1 Tax=Manduca sexta TaxID=7130 RepID=UPI00188F793E|nr:sodium-independent sulfate anion transporter [Manduca sexta]